MNTLITNIGQLVTPQGNGPVEGERMKALRVYERVELRIDEERITAVGPEVDRTNVDLTLDAHGGVLLPGLVDPHTHAVFAATREEEFLARLQGVPYTEGGSLRARTPWQKRERTTWWRGPSPIFNVCSPAERRPLRSKAGTV